MESHRQSFHLQLLFVLTSKVSPLQTFGWILFLFRFAFLSILPLSVFGEFNPLTLKVRTDRKGFISVILLFILYMPNNFSPLFSTSMSSV